jgi:hypothetical protein
MNNNKFYTAFLYQFLFLSIGVFGTVYQFSMHASFNDRIAKYWEWTIDESDKNNPIVYYKGKEFSKNQVQNWSNKLFNQFKLANVIPKGFSREIIEGMMERIKESFDYLADPLNANGVWRNYARADLSAELLENLAKADQLSDYPYRTEQDIQRYYKKWFVTRALLGVATLGIIDITYWQRDLIKDYLQNAVASLFNRLLIKKAGS